MIRYYLIIDLGQHTKTIETNKTDFENWINELSTEFEIIKKENEGEIYEIRNYWGDLQLIGFTLIEKEIEDNLPF